MLFTALSYAQVGINTNTPDASSALEIESTTGGILIPRMTETQRDAIVSPASGLMIYQTDEVSGFYFYNGTGWTKIDGVAGPQGEAGVAGPAGAPGPIGPAGADGADGAQGAVGPVGPAGPTGNTGPAGADGADGTQGPVGNTGPAGPQGDQGIQGATGATGPQGLAGADGVDGIQGPVGPVGPAGPQGDQGLQGLAGADGEDGAQGPVGPTGNTGLTGPVGPAGAQGLQGPAGAAGSQGIAGNGIVSATDNNNGTFTLAFDDGSTFTTSDLTGPSGETGPQGIQGDPASEVDQGYIEGVYCTKPGATAYSKDTGQSVICTPYLTINGSEQYLITNELICPDNSEGTATNIEYWISFEVSQPIMAYLLHIEPFAYNSFCGNVGGGIFRNIYKTTSSTFNSNSNLGDLIFNSQVTSSIPKMIFSPGFTYTIRLAGFDSYTTRTTSVSNYTINETLFNNVKFYSSSPESSVLNETTDQWALLYNFGPSWVNGNILTVFTEWELRWENN